MERRTCSLENRTARLVETMSMAMVCPGVQVVPAAISSTTDQVPLAHCWKDVPLMQFHIPSVVQAVPAAIALPAPAVPVLAGLATGVTELAATEAAGLEATTGLAVTDEAETDAAVVVAGTGSTVAVVAAASDVGVLTALADGSSAIEVAVWRNAPPGIEAEAAALLVATGAASELVVAAAATLDESDPDDPELPDTKEELVVRPSTPVAEQELGPEDHPISRLAISEA